MMYYAGVGSRETPQDVLKIMWKIGRYLALNGYTLRSGGGAKGADTAFENGCDSVRGSKEIFYANNNKGTLMLAEAYTCGRTDGFKCSPCLGEV